MVETTEVGMEVKAGDSACAQVDGYGAHHGEL